MCGSCCPQPSSYGVLVRCLAVLAGASVVLLHLLCCNAGAVRTACRLPVPDLACIFLLGLHTAFAFRQTHGSLLVVSENQCDVQWIDEFSEMNAALQQHAGRSMPTGLLVLAGRSQTKRISQIELDHLLH